MNIVGEGLTVRSFNEQISLESRTYKGRPTFGTGSWGKNGLGR